MNKICLAADLPSRWWVLREVLNGNTLEANRVYTTKLTSTTAVFFPLAHLPLSDCAKILRQGLENDDLLQMAVNYLCEQSSRFREDVNPAPLVCFSLIFYFCH